MNQYINLINQIEDTYNVLDFHELNINDLNNFNHDL